MALFIREVLRYCTFHSSVRSYLDMNPGFSATQKSIQIKTVKAERVSEA